ncbi:hypothetical protein [Tenacibaculum insulae]|uniref:hypothetical protein n=1 Tax=Tenacibaculum insulae TaxID=2029677 RepID=UPI003AB392BE
MGEISEIIPKAPHPRIKKELVRLANLLPKMKPAKQSGEAVSVRYTLKLTFIIV